MYLLPLKSKQVITVSFVWKINENVMVIISPSKLINLIISVQ